MCGIAGIMCLKHQRSQEDRGLFLIKRMNDIQKHRGPDGSGYAELDSGNVYLGHRRLAIIDLNVKADQPMVSYDKRYTITYNGEIYNYKELKKELIKYGHIFTTDSDTEVLLNAYVQWGSTCVHKLNGIFAFAIWDDYKKELFIARDRYGTKPLYYAKINDQFVFASEYKAIMLHPEFKREINYCALKEYFTFQNLFTNNSILNGIKLLDPGCYMVISYGNNIMMAENRYWDFGFKEEKKIISREEYYEELDRLFVQAVNRQLISDVPIGTYLSGGIDSGSITAIASKSIRNLKTFTCGFDLHSASGMELAYDEREKAEYMSYLFGTEHYEMVLKAGDMERCVNELVWHLEDPRVGQSYPNYYAAKLSSSFVKVVLAGTGGDELFAGYPWRYYRAARCNNFNDYIDNYYQYWQRLIKETEIDVFFEPVVEKMSIFSTKEIFRNAFKMKEREISSIADSINHSLYLEAKTFLHGLLIVEDKLSMAHGLESRVPFLDNDLVDFAMKVPVNLKLLDIEKVDKINENDLGIKVNQYYARNKDGKIILRDIMKKYIPHEITDGNKQGFSAPDASWFKGDSIEYVKSVIFDSNADMYEYINKKKAQQVLKEHIAGKSNNRLLIWSLINFEAWLKQFMSR